MAMVQLKDEKMGMTIKEDKGIEEELEQIRDNMFLSLDKALTSMKGKSILLDTYNGLMVDVYMPEFDYNCSPNCKNQLLLNFKDEDESILGVTVKLDDIEDVEIMDNTDFDGNLDEFETEYACECIKIDLLNHMCVRLQVQF